jgi:hypothetical protein
MFSKIRSAMFALAAVTALGLGALVTTTDSADARGFHGNGGFKSGGGNFGRVHIGGGRHLGGIRPIGRPHFRPGLHRPGLHRPGLTLGHRWPIVRPHFHPRPHWCWRFPWRCKVGIRWPRPIIVGAPVIAATTYAVAPAVATARPCNCLTKEYTPDNLVVFKDLCTKEVASAPIGNTQVQLPAQTQQQ